MSRKRRDPSRMSTRSLNEAARRLKLPTPSQMTPADLEEAQTCTGCVARIEDGVRMVRALTGCPAHARGNGR